MPNLPAAPLPAKVPPITVTNPEVVHIFWTGGWDSTYRLLSLLEAGCLVQPIYLVTTRRKSSLVELATMSRLRDRLFLDKPAWREKLKPLQITNARDIPPDDDLTACYRHLVKRSPLGSQYECISLYAKAFCHQPVELGIHRDDKARVFLKDCVVFEGDGIYRAAVLSPDHRRGDLRLFQFFRFPLFDLTKQDMNQQAQQRGWTTYMEMTWFCHDPRPDGRPCGRCAGCVYTREEGLGWRVPSPGMGARLFRWISGRLPYRLKYQLKRLRDRVRSADH